MEDTDIVKYFSELPPYERDILEISNEKLDKSIKLHNYGASSVYEKQKDLTSNDDYVMPSIGLLDRLEKARSEQRLGEVILLSSIALSDTPPDQIHKGLFREVIGGLIAVGLTKEARSLAREVILGMSEK